MAANSKRVMELTKEFITTATGFTSDEENYKLCYQYAMSNFKYHRYLSVDSLKVGRSIESLCTKFKIHSQPERAQALQLLTDQFLDLRLWKSFSKSDTHYGILLFLLNVSHSPTNSTYTPSPFIPLPTLVRGGEKFDWRAYLMEGIEYPTYSDTDSSDWSDPSPDEEDDKQLDLNDSALGKEVSSDTEQDPLAKAAMSRQWLVDNVVTPYWQPTAPAAYRRLRDPNIVCHPACNLAIDWFSYSQSSSPFPVSSSSSTLITETQAVRETLWLLIGVQKSFIYQISSDGVVTVRPYLHLSHLTPLALRCILEWFASLATELNKLQHFITNTQRNMADPLCSHTSMTEQAMMDGILCYLDGFFKKLHEVEDSVIKQRQFVSLLKLQNIFHSLDREVRCLASVLPLERRLPGEHVDNSQACCQLLDSLWTALETADTLGQPGFSLVKLLFPLFVMTTRPYMSILNGWMDKAELRDYHEELFIHRCTVGQASDLQMYWEHCYQLKQHIPIFLTPIADKLLAVGKARHLMEAVDIAVSKQQLCRSPSRTDCATSPGNSLYNRLMAALQANLSLSEHCAPPPRDLVPMLDYNTSTVDESDSSSEVSLPSPPPRSGNVYHYERGEAAYWNTDPLLQLVMSELHEQIAQHKTNRKKCDSQSIQEWKKLQSLLDAETSLDCPLSILIQNCLYPLVIRQHYETSASLIDLLQAQLRLTEHFNNVRLFFLMEAGDAMHHFSSELFSRILGTDSWYEPSFLNSILQDALHDRYPDLDKILTLQVAMPNLPPPPIQSINLLSLHYKVPWPLDVIFSDSLMEVYNKVFRFLLQVKFAKWSLDEIRIGDYRGSRGNVKIHKLHLLRAKLLHFVNCLSYYLLTRILHSSGLEFRQQMEEAQDLDAIIELHRDYVSAVHNRCLLHKNAGYVMEAITKILTLTLTFHKKWSLGLAHFSWSEAERLELEFSRCSQFLLYCLATQIRKGLSPHMESLADALSSLHSDTKLFS